ncbi:MAG: nucleotidyltransferase domain-containing protein [Deltaproteobacteria bacterium]|nr:nucleotidyltransferase domain-containing protein [Deltaproteobacteria bacterium]
MQTIKKALGPILIKAVLFGSRARGEGHESSDVDILVLVKTMDTSTKHLVWDAAEDIFLETGIDISPLVITQEKFERWRRLERLLPREIEKEGVVL